MPEPVWRTIATQLAPKIPPETLPAALPQIIAPRNGKWQATDVVIEDLPTHRFIRGVETSRSETLWYVWFENGGFAHNTSLVIFWRNPEIQFAAGFTGDEAATCAIARAYDGSPFYVWGPAGG